VVLLQVDLAVLVWASSFGKRVSARAATASRTRYGLRLFRRDFSTLSVALSVLASDFSDEDNLRRSRQE
jgi:hypothetical protein